MMGNHSLWGKNSCLYNDVLRIPLLIHHPGQTEAKRIPERVLSTEVFPTLLSMAGAEVPENIDGTTLSGQVEKGGRDVIFSSTEGRVAVIKGDWKLCVNGVGFELTDDTRIYHELYDLKNDPHEYTNLYSDARFADIRSELEALLDSEPNLMRTVFRQKTGPAYWFNAGNGAGYETNGL